MSKFKKAAAGAGILGAIVGGMFGKSNTNDNYAKVRSNESRASIQRDVNRPKHYKKKQK